MTSDEQLNAILGEAIKALVDSGAPAAFIGSFSSTYGPRFAQHLGLPLESPPDLKATISEAVTQAVQQVLGQQIPSSALGPSRDSRVRVQVVCGGRRTSVTIRKSSIERVASVLGSRDESTKVIRQLAANAPAEAANRSLWVENQIEAYLQLRAAPLPPGLPAGVQTH